MGAKTNKWIVWGALAILLVSGGATHAADTVPSSYAPVVINEPFSKIMARMEAAKPEIIKRQMDLLDMRYDLSDRPAKGVMMSGGINAVQEGVRVKPPQGVTWQNLAEMTPEQIREKGSLAQGISTPAPPQPSRGRDAFPKIPHQ